jgi:hypothetical protein
MIRRTILCCLHFQGNFSKEENYSTQKETTTIIDRELSSGMWKSQIWDAIMNETNYRAVLTRICRSQWPRCLRGRSTAACLLRLWVRIPPEAWMFVYCECCVLSGRGLCDGLITRPEESYRLWRVTCVWSRKPREWGGHSPRWVAAPHKKKLTRICVTCCKIQ